ncbi:MAG: hypothetical protein AAB627_00165 [Patescibacteria group bacterium]
MFSKFSVKTAVIVAFVLLIAAGTLVYATHSWGPYHWARTANPFNLKLGDNVTTAWDAYLAEASSDWSKSTVLDTTVVAGGTTARRCRPTSGRVEVCNYGYGFNGWLGVASIWVSGDHIVKGMVKMNDSYFNTSTYNTPAWRRLVMCQEVGHEFGLDHQDENFYNPNLGTCMDYASDPDGPPSNEHPNAHDYDQLETIYAHVDSITTVSQTVFSNGNGNAADAAEWGRELRKDSKGRTSLYVRDLGNNEKVFTFILWAD